ncbi:DEAD/DEAH box helicase family protein, partial [Candidatus Latescibacterota bacterium]
MSDFKLNSDYRPRGDQGSAIETLTRCLRNGDRHQTLLGVTGSGKTFTVANVIEQINRPTLVLSHNKTLVAQLFGEFKALFPENAVEFFISYYDYYQPEAYVPASDTFIEKESDVNEEIDRLRLRATSSLLERNDVIIVASVSCIYGLGSPQEYEKLHLILNVGDRVDRDDVIRRLVDIHYARSDFGLERGNFRVRGDVLEIMPAYDERVIRIEFFGDVVEAISEVNKVSGKIVDIRNRA